MRLRGDLFWEDLDEYYWRREEEEKVGPRESRLD